jgi:GH15 family glucan-1,4-alpha-glucosidase
MQILYGIAGERRLPEIGLSWLAGYQGSKPVRIGNAAHEQFQLDVYGELLAAFYLGRRTGARLARLVESRRDTDGPPREGL